MCAAGRDLWTERAEFVAQSLTDFRAFCGLLEIQPKEGGGRIPFILSPIQQKYCTMRSPRDIILKPRQVFITTLEAARDLWWFITKPGARVVVVCQSKTDHGPRDEIAEKFRIFFDSLVKLGMRFEFGREAIGTWSLPKRDATLKILEAGASEMAALKIGRGGTVNRLHFTEAAFFEHASTTFNSLLESVPAPEKGSEIVSESTANGAGGFYYEQWQSAVRGANGYQPIFFRWLEHPEYVVPLEPGEVIQPENDREAKLLELGVTPDQLKWYRRKMEDKGKYLTLQEYPSDPATCFLVSGRPFFEPEVVDKQMRDAVVPAKVEEHGALRIWSPPEKGRQYVIPVDTAEGLSEDNDPDKADFCAAGVLRRNGEHAATLHGRWPAWEFARHLVKLAKHYNNALIAVERNNHGYAVLQAITREQKYPYVYYHADKKWGFPTTAVTRPMMLDQLFDAHTNGTFVTSDTMLLGEMRTFVVGPNGRAEAAKGTHDDLVMMMAIGWTVICMPARAQNIPNLRPG